MNEKDIEELRKEIEAVKHIKEDVKFVELLKTIKIICVLWGVSLILVIGSFLLYLSEYYFAGVLESVTYQQDGHGINNVNTGEQGDVINGADTEY